MITVNLYTRKDCELCDEARAALAELQSKVPHKVVEIDIDSSPELVKKYGVEVPVVVAGPYTMRAPIDPKDLYITLASVQRSTEEEQALSKKIAAQPLAEYASHWTQGDKLSYWLSKHYLAFLNVLVLIYVGLPFLAPVLMKAGMPGPAGLIYKGYGAVCHQMAFRSWFLFGEQSAYPRRAAQVPGLIPYEDATGLPTEDVISARNFLGNPQIGYKVAFCERDVAIYGGILLFGLIYPLTGRRLPALHWILWAILALGPIGLDGFSQLLSQPPFHLIPYRESTPFLRSLTGGLFGFMTAWFGYPYVEESMRETLKYLDAKLARLQARGIPVTGK